MKEIIYKQNAIDAIKEGKNKFRYPTDALQYAENNIVHLPSAQRKGEWKTTYLDHEMMGERPRILYCSECNQCIAYPTNFCPTCGADMRGEEE